MASYRHPWNSLVHGVKLYDLCELILAMLSKYILSKSRRCYLEMGFHKRGKISVTYLYFNLLLKHKIFKFTLNKLEHIFNQSRDDSLHFSKNPPFSSALY